jgi:hypothetical protein
MKYLPLIALILTLSCRQKDVVPNTCGVKKPLKDLPWLVALTEDKSISMGFTLSQAIYKKQTVYVYVECPNCIAGPNITIFSCDGSKLCSGLLVRKDDACQAIEDELTNKRVLLKR